MSAIVVGLVYGKEFHGSLDRNLILPTVQWQSSSSEGRPYKQKPLTVSQSISAT